VFLLGKEKLNGANFNDWCRNLIIVLKQEKNEFVIRKSYPDDLPTSSSATDRRAHEKQCDDALNMRCFLLATMSPNLQK
jgi:hypothetical protein